MLAPALTDFLRARRPDCNARFAAARRRWPRLDAEDFSLFLRDQVSPLAAALDVGNSHQVLAHAYGIGLQLVAEKLAGPSATNPAINLIWNEAFPRMPGLIAGSPRRVLVALGNAAHQLAATPDTTPDIWRKRLVDFIPKLSDPDELLVMAQVLAWRAGLSHFRKAALSAADSLPPELALEALDAPPGSDWAAFRDAHSRDPWFGYDAHGWVIDPGSPGHKIGSFRGFGGLFLTPPQVTTSESEIFVISGGDAWILVADAFGATLHRASPEEIGNAVRAPSARPISPTPMSAPRPGAIRFGSVREPPANESDGSNKQLEGCLARRAFGVEPLHPARPSHALRDR